jgi:hypothetical protein
MSDRDHLPSYSPVGGLAPEPERADLTRDFSSSDPAAPASVATPGMAPPLSAGRYHMLDEIARGGMGVIWRATDTTLRREVAVKLAAGQVRPRLRHCPSLRRRGPHHRPIAAPRNPAGA